MVFISHSSKDTSFVRFLVHILNFYSIKTWCSQSDEIKDNILSNEIENILAQSEKLLVVISSNAIDCPWIQTEITIFKVLNPGAEIIPLIIENTALKHAMPSLRKFKEIDFSKNLKAGFRELFSRLGQDFRHIKDRRNGIDRRQGDDRRVKTDRRNEDAIQRLQESFWNYYSQERGVRKEDEVNASIYEMFLLLDAISPLTKKYLCYDDSGNLYNMDDIIVAYAHEVWSNFRVDDSGCDSNCIKAIELTNALAQKIATRYIVKNKDRRRPRDRRSGTDRREVNNSIIKIVDFDGMFVRG